MSYKNCFFVFFVVIAQLILKDNVIERRLFATELAFTQSDIKVIQFLDEIQSELDKADQDVLVVFDVDDVLICSDDMVLRPCASHFRPQSWKDINPQEVPYFLSIMLNESQVHLVESSTSQFIENLQARGVKTIALTAARKGRFGVIKNAEDWRLNILKQFNIDFSHSFSKNTIYFDEISQKENSYSLFKCGILFLGDEKNTKGALLIQFLTKLDWKPRKIIFIDDKRSNLVSVAEALKEINIPFQGYEFKGVWNLPGEFSEHLAEIQFAYLRKNHKWLNDCSAKKEAQY